MTDDDAVDQARTELRALLDPDWQPSEKEPEPPLNRIMGVWPLDEHGGTQPFQANPFYLPADDNSPLDPVDGILRLLVKGEDVSIELLTEALADILLEIAIDDDGVAIVRPAPDGLPSVQVATAPGHRARVAAPDWRPVTVRDLSAAMPDSGVDVLLNPGSEASMRVDAELIRRAATVQPELVPPTD